MNYKICMLRECKNCKYEINCFKEQKNEHSNNKHGKTEQHIILQMIEHKLQ